MLICERQMSGSGETRLPSVPVEEWNAHSLPSSETICGLISREETMLSDPCQRSESMVFQTACLAAAFAAITLFVVCILPAAAQSPAKSELGKFLDRKSTRLNSSHLGISYAVFCLKTKK